VSKTSTGSELRLVVNPITRPQITFDQEQLAAIAHRGAPLIIRGAAGTGKTTALIECAISRIRSGAPADSILILTFGRERASEIRDAIVLASDGTLQEPVARTFHALAYSILSMTSGENFRETVLISGGEQEAFIRQLLQGNLEDKVDWWPADLLMDKAAVDNVVMGEPLLTQGFIRELRDLMMRATERGLTPAQLAEKGQRLNERFWSPAAKFWEQYLQISAGMDIGAGDSKMRIDPSEIINAAIAHLNTNPDLLQSLRARFSTIMVDEFHETDPAQRRLLELLIGADSVFVLDPQSSVGRFLRNSQSNFDQRRKKHSTSLTQSSAHI
jgi:superfamily I DNA/RNA helicase